MASRCAEVLDRVARTSAETRRLSEQRAHLLDRQRRLRLARCGPDFRILGLASAANRIVLRHDGEVPVLVLTGDFDLDDAEELRQAFESLAGRHDRVTVDVSDTTFMDSSAINTLLHARRDGLAVALRGRGVARRTITLMGLDEVFEHED